MKPEDYVWIQDAAKEYDRSREWLDKQVAEGRLSVVQVPGDRRMYLLRAELDKLLRPHVVRPATQDQAG
jgi:hypothetical protein